MHETVVIEKSVWDRELNKLAALAKLHWPAAVELTTSSDTNSTVANISFLTFSQSTDNA